MEKGVKKAIAVGSCVAMAAVTVKGVKRLKKEPITQVYYNAAETLLWLYCIKASTSLLISV